MYCAWPPVHHGEDRRLLLKQHRTVDINLLLQTMLMESPPPSPLPVKDSVMGKSWRRIFFGFMSFAAWVFHCFIGRGVYLYLSVSPMPSSLTGIPYKEWLWQKHLQLSLFHHILSAYSVPHPLTLALCLPFTLLHLLPTQHFKQCLPCLHP